MKQRKRRFYVLDKIQVGRSQYIVGRKVIWVFEKLTLPYKPSVLQ